MASSDAFDVFNAIQEADSREDYNIIIEFVKECEDPRSLEDGIRKNGLLHYCIENQKFQLMSDLLALEKLPIDQENDEGQTPLFYSLDLGLGEFAIKLIEAGADVNIGDFTKEYPLHLVMGRDTKYARLLLENGATDTINCQNQYGNTPLHCAAQFEDLENVCLLLYHDADTDIVNNAGFSPFMEALRGSNHELQEILIEYETDFNRQGEDDYLLQIAIDNKSPFTKEIVRRGADIYSYEILQCCLAVLNLDDFKEFWYKKIFEYNPHCAEILQQITNAIVVENEFILFLEFIIESEELQYAMPYLATDGITRSLLMLTLHSLNRELAERAIYVLLSYGLCLSEEDLAYIYTEYRTEETENDEFLRLFLFMDVSVSNERHLIPSIIFSVSKDIDDIIESHMKTGLLDYRNSDLVMKWLARHLVHPKLYRKILDQTENPPLVRNEKIRNKLKNNFPKLLDLSRNKVRQWINSKWKIQNSCQFYTIVERLPIPTVLKGVIEFRRGIY